MKKSLFLLPLAAAMMVGCANDGFDANGDKVGSGETELRYLAVNIVDNSTGTRAYDNTNSNESVNNPGTDYEEGKPAENEVTSITFYMYNAAGSIVGTPHVATAEDAGDDTANTIEKKLQAVIVFEEEKEPETKPSQIVAILNAPEISNYGTLSNLQDAVDDYMTNATTTGKFIMSNSVYAKDGSTAVVAYPIAETDFKDSKAEALANPVDIYVERVVAKVRVTIGTSLKEATGVNGENIYEITGLTNNQQDVYGEDGANATAKNIYVKLLGWNVTGTATESRLLKKINPAWGGTNWNSENFAWGTNNAWNYPTFFRSFWAVNPEGFGMEDLQFGNFNGSASGSDDATNKANAANAQLNTSFGKDTEVYLQENASWDNTVSGSTGKNPEYATKLIVAAQLVGEDGNGLDLGWYAGSYYMQTDLKKVIVNHAKIFKKTTASGGGDTYSQADDINIEFKTATAAEKASVPTSPDDDDDKTVNRYNSYAQAVEGNGFTFAAGTYYVKTSEGAYTELTTLAALNDELLAVGPVKVWTSGYTYYWLDIEHLGAPQSAAEEATKGENYGRYGIVRNHIYQYELGSIKGFGIPVQDPSETIYPEEPNDPEMMYLAARINILSWRLVSHEDTQLGW